MEKIAIYCEFDYNNRTLGDVSYELISKAFELKGQANSLCGADFEIEAVVCADELPTECIKKAYRCGANKVVLIKNRIFNVFSQTVMANAFIEYYKHNNSRIILFPATFQGRLIAPRITTILDTGLVADCTGLEFIIKDRELKLAPTRPTFGSELMATILSKKLPECATIRPNTFKIKEYENLNGEFSEIDYFTYPDYRMKLLKTLVDDKEDISDFSNAKIVLCAGLGVANNKNKEYIEKLQKLAHLIGAKFACTRKLVDFDLVSRANQIGQTGSTVQADIYVGFGVSGALQHICGMKNCKTIIAINKDENAPIFDYCDYKVVYDAKTIIDQLLTSLFDNE